MPDLGDRRRPDLKHLDQKDRVSRQKNRIYKCTRCEVELVVPRAMEEYVKSGRIRCNSKGCVAARIAGKNNRYLRK